MVRSKSRSRSRSRSCHSRQTSAKYRNRPSPPYPANECPQGTKKRGNDGKVYVVKLDSRGIGRWVPYHSVSKSKVHRGARSKSRSRSKSRTKSRSKSRSVRTRLPAKLTFSSPPFGSVSIKAGELGYVRNGSVRLQRSKKDGRIFFPTKVAGVTYVEASPGSRVFHRHTK